MFEPIDVWFKKGFRIKQQKAAKTASHDRVRTRSGTKPASNNGVGFLPKPGPKYIESVIRKASEVMVKITDSSSGMATVRHHLGYISRNGNVELTNDCGESIHRRRDIGTRCSGRSPRLGAGRQAVDELREQLGLASSNRKQQARVPAHRVLHAGRNPEKAMRESVAQFA